MTSSTSTWTWRGNGMPHERGTTSAPRGRRADPPEAQSNMVEGPGVRRGGVRHGDLHVQPIDVLLGPRAHPLLRGSREEEEGGGGLARQRRASAGVPRG